MILFIFIYYILNDSWQSKTNNKIIKPVFSVLLDKQRWINSLILDFSSVCTFRLPSGNMYAMHMYVSVARAVVVVIVLSLD
jgi:hypothetical protein